MKLISKVKGWFKDEPKAQVNVNYDAFGTGADLLSYVAMQGVPAELRLSPQQASTVSAADACIRIIRDAISAGTWMVYRRDVSGQRVVMPPSDDLQWKLNFQPNPWMTAQSMWEAVLYQMMVDGNAYVALNLDAAGRRELIPLLPGRTQVVWNGDQLIYRYSQPDGGDAYLEQSEVLHFRGPSCSGLMGDSVVYRAINAISLAYAQERYAQLYFANGANVGGILKATVANKDTQDRLRDEFAKKRSGLGKSHAFLMLPPGVEFEKAGETPESSQLIEGRTWSAQEIAMHFGVPPYMLGVAKSSQEYTTDSERSGITFINNTLRPWARRIQQELTIKLLLGSPKDIELDLSHLTQPDQKTRAEIHAIYLNSRVYSVNEVREDLGKGPVEGGDERASAAPPSPFQRKPVEPQEDEPNDVEAALALDAYSRKVKARSADLTKSKAADAEQKIEQYRAQCRQEATGKLFALGWDAARASIALDRADEGTSISDIVRG